jgi:signal peptidase I
MEEVNLGTDIPTSYSKSYVSNVTSCVLNDLWEELVIKHGTCWAKVVSNSMYPMIRRDDQVLVERIYSESVRFGDIVVFRKDGRLTVHRVIGKREVGGEYHFLEKGDANLQSSLVPAKEIVGRVTIIKNKGKTLPVISGSGRLLQLTLACISYTSLQLRAMLKYRLVWGRHTSHKHRYYVVYKRFFFLLYRIALGLFLKRSEIE